MRTFGALLLALGLSGCALFRDFDELTREAMSPQELCANRCDDGDPCTVDRCGDGGCIHEPLSCEDAEDGCPRACEAGRCVRRAGIVADDLQETAVGDIYYSQLIEHEGRFFHAIHGRFENVNDILLRSYPSEGNTRHARELALTATTEPKGYQPISPGSMIAAADGTLYTYFAARPVESDPNTAGTVLRVATNLDLNLRGSPVINVANVSNFRSRSRRMGPVAGLTRSGEPFVAWEGCTLSGDECLGEEPELVGDGGLYVQIGEQPVNAPEHLFHPYEFRALAALPGADVPTLVWLSHGPGQTRLNLWSTTTETASATRGVDAGVADAGALFPPACVVPSGTGYSLATTQHRPQLWGLAWTTRADDGFLGALSSLCTDRNCMPTAGSLGNCVPLADDLQRLEGARHVALGSVEHPESDDEIYQVTAHTFADEGLIHLALRLDRVAPGALAPQSHLATVTLASAKTAELPEWPTLAVSNEGKLLVSWIQPRAAQTELHVQRHRICFGEPLER